MKQKRKILLIFFLVAGFTAFAQPLPKKDTATVNKLLDDSRALIGTDSTQAITLATQAKEMAEEINYLKGKALALKNIGMVHYYKGKYAETLDYWNQSLQVFETLKDDIGISNMLNNIGAIYFNQGADAKALEYSLKSLQLAEKTGDTLRMISALVNVGTTYYNKKDPVALTYLLKAIPLVEANIKTHTEPYVVITGDIGEIYTDNNDHDKAMDYFKKSIKVAESNNLSSAFSVNGIGKLYQREGKLQEALEFHNQALAIARKFDDQVQVVRGLKGVADVYSKLNNTNLAIDYYKQAKTVAESIDDLKIELQELYKEMAASYSKKRDYSNAFLYQSLYADIKDTLYTVDSKKKLNQLQFDFELSKKEVELSRKEVEINLKEVRIKTERQARIGVTIGLGLLLVLAVIIYRNYRQKAKTNKILDKQKDQIENLLLNILPKEVASELQAKGQATPRFYEKASVLFTDFVGFTRIADSLSPQEVVAELNECFMAFDSIVEYHKLEKIKTIGDAYMCAGGIPVPDEDHTMNIIKASLEIQEYMRIKNEKRRFAGLPPWELRIGVHSGPLVAGVVGKNKYAYDIWGSTVNIASRMESNGEAGKVNISSATYDIIKSKYSCIYRGKISAKNIGEIDMYFVEKERKVQLAQDQFVMIYPERNLDNS